MHIHELLDGHILHETDPVGRTELDSPGTGTTTPMATIAAPGAASPNQAGGPPYPANSRRQMRTPHIAVGSTTPSWVRPSLDKDPTGFTSMGPIGGR